MPIGLISSFLEKPSAPKSRKILWNKPYNTYFEDRGKLFTQVACHDVELDCGHKGKYCHTGLILPNMECKECMKLEKIRAADYIIDRLNVKYGINIISLLTGNGSLVINDAIAKNKNITPICVHHEQDAGYFALGYSKYNNRLSVVNPTTGCASVSCLTPLLAAYHDHTPILFLSGNVALKQTSRYHRLHNNVNLKKLGTQELDIIEIVKPLTKYSVMIEDPCTLR